MANDDPIVVDNPGVIVDLLVGGGIEEGGKVTRGCDKLTHLFVFDSKGLTEDSSSPQNYLFTALDADKSVSFTLSKPDPVEQLMFNVSGTEVKITVAPSSGGTGSGLQLISTTDFRRFKLGAPESRNIEAINYVKDDRTLHLVKLSENGRHIIMLIPNGNKTQLEQLAAAIQSALT